MASFFRTYLEMKTGGYTRTVGSGSTSLRVHRYTVPKNRYAIVFMTSVTISSSAGGWVTLMPGAQFYVPGTPDPVPGFERIGVGVPEPFSQAHMVAGQLILQADEQLLSDDSGEVGSTLAASWTIFEFALGT